MTENKKLILNGILENIEKTETIYDHEKGGKEKIGESPPVVIVLRGIYNHLIISTQNGQKKEFLFPGHVSSTSEGNPIEIYEEGHGSFEIFDLKLKKHYKSLFISPKSI